MLPGIAHQDAGVEAADVDPHLQRGGGDHAVELPLEERLLDAPPLLGEEAGAVARHPSGELRLLAPEPGVEELGDPPRLGEDDRLEPRPDEAREELERHRVGARLRPEEQQVAPLARRAGLGDPVELPAGEGLGELPGVGRRGRGGDQHRIAPHRAAEAEEALEDVMEMAAEDPAVGVELVEHDPAQVGQERPPAGPVAEHCPGGACPDWRSPRGENSCGSPSASRWGCRRRRSRTRRPRAAARRPRRDGGTSPAGPAPAPSGGRGTSRAPGRRAPPPRAAAPGRRATCRRPWGW